MKELMLLAESESIYRALHGWAIRINWTPPPAKPFTFNKPWKTIGCFLRYRPMTYVDRYERQYYECYGRVAGEWTLLVCTWDLDRLTRTMVQATQRELAVDQATFMQRKFYDRIWFKESAQWQRRHRREAPTTLGESS